MILCITKNQVQNVRRRRILAGNVTLKAIDRKSFERGNFLVFRPALLKIAYFNSGNRQLSIAVLPKKLRQRNNVDPSRGAP